MTPDQTSNIPLADIKMLPGRRRLDPAWVETLAALFSSQGQLSPIEVIAVGDGFRLVFGRHRLGAASHLGWKTIKAVVKEAQAFADEAEITLREITENMARRELSVLDRSVDIARWREAYNAAHVVSKGGRRAKGVTAEELTAKFAVSFTQAAQKAFSLSERSIFFAVKIASILDDIRDQIALLPIAHNQSELLLLAAEPGERQAKIADLLTADDAKATTIAGAIAIIDALPAPAKEPRWQKVSTAFSNLAQRDQDAFFELHEAAITRWLEGRVS